MTRTLIADIPQHIGSTVTVAGWVSVRRDHGKLVFIDLRDRSGSVQLVIAPDQPEALSRAQTMRSEFVVQATGLVKARPAKKSAPPSPADGIEIAVTQIDILAQPVAELPLDLSQETLDLNLDTLLNHRTLVLRHPNIRAIFKTYSELLAGYDAVMREHGFTEIKTPKILSSATEGGANFFKIKYFERDAYLAQSPQFYKQAGMSVFERVFEIGPVFRAEPSFTTRHVNEYTGLDAEMGFIESVEDVMAMLETVIQSMFAHVGKTCADAFVLHGASVPPAVPIPRLRLSEALVILKSEYGKEVENEDIDAEGERLIGEYVHKKYGSDLVFLTHYPAHLRPFYSQPSEDTCSTETFDLIFRGVEIASGGERISQYETLKRNIEKRGLDPAQFSDYLEIFKYGTPRHGGWGLGSERIVQKLLGLGSIKEAVLYPRDVKRLAP